jgi:hypothetical protein
MAAGTRFVVYGVDAEV